MIFKKNKIKQMTILYFHINGSGSPFWLEEKKNILGELYYTNMIWPENVSTELKNAYRRILTLHRIHQNPIDINFPSLWTQEVCDLYNEFVTDFINLSNSELKEYSIINKNENFNQDSRLISYRQNILKSHLDQNKTFNTKKEFEEYLRSKQEFKSVLTNELDFEKITRIEQTEYNTFNRITLNFENYDNFQIALCPYSNKTFVIDINIGGHYAVYFAIRINRNDILNDQLKIISLAKTINS
jgi:hypothetical protein